MQHDTFTNGPQSIKASGLDNIQARLAQETDRLQAHVIVIEDANTRILGATKSNDEGMGLHPCRAGSLGAIEDKLDFLAALIERLCSATARLKDVG